jgi:catechol 2,3-dioxygenase-like lactoylglutathione lyase family enzyme
VADADVRRALERFYLEVFAAQTYYEACAVDSMPREESMLLIGDVCLLPLSPTDIGSDEGRTLAALVGRFSQIAIKVTDARAAAAHLRAHGITPQYLHPRHESLFFVTDPIETLGVRFEFCAVDIPNDLRLRADWSAQWWLDHHPLAIAGLSSIVTATRDLAAASAFYTGVLGCVPLGERDVPELGAKARAFRLGLERPFVIEAWVPSNTTSSLSRYVSDLGSGIYAVTFKSESVPGVAKYLETSGVKWCLEGAHRITIDPADSFGVTLSFVDEEPWGLGALGRAKGA